MIITMATIMAMRIRMTSTAITIMGMIALTRITTMIMRTITTTHMTRPEAR
jgi:hypothetical protein